MTDSDKPLVQIPKPDGECFCSVLVICIAIIILAGLDKLPW